jgi:hypothetical protein
VNLAALVNRARDQFREHGAIRTVGAVAEYCGVHINRRCQSFGQALKTDRGREYPLAVRAAAIRLGCSAEQYLWLGLSGSKADRFLTSTDPFLEINGGYVRPLHHKYDFHMSTAHHRPMPGLYGTIDGGEFNPVGSTAVGLTELVRREDRLLVKPVTGAKGKGVHVLGADEMLPGSEVAASPIGDEDLTFSARDGSIVTEFVRQHDYAADIFPRATNTVRIHTVIDPTTGEISPLRASHRFGTRASAPTDNWSQGGYVAPVDLRSGEIKPLITLDEPPRRRVDRHPGTGEQVAGVTVPYWAEVCDLAREAASLHRYAPLVGWDVAITSEGPVLLEANARPSIVGLQLTEGLFEDPRVRRLFRRHGSLS